MEGSDPVTGWNSGTERVTCVSLRLAALTFFKIYIYIFLCKIGTKTSTDLPKYSREEQLSFTWIPFKPCNASAVFWWLWFPQNVAPFFSPGSWWASPRESQHLSSMTSSFSILTWPGWLGMTQGLCCCRLWEMCMSATELPSLPGLGK